MTTRYRIAYMRDGEPIRRAPRFDDEAAAQAAADDLNARHPTMKHWVEEVVVIEYWEDEYE